MILIKFWGIIFTISFAAMLLNKKAMMALIQAEENTHFFLLHGMIALFVGAISISIHNIWTPDIAGLITLFGWLALARGIIRLGFAEQGMKLSKTFTKNTIFIYSLSTTFFVLGLYLLYLGFIQ